MTSHAGPLTRADLDALRPVEGSERYELLDGAIIVTPGPGRWHQAVVVELTAPLLAVEVLSPSTRRIDQLLKRDRFAAAGVCSYWLVDPLEPSVRVLELEDGDYREVQVRRGSERVQVTAPFSLEFTPAELLLE